jgi:predicted cupin superfamily sugar epimerase
MPERPHPLIQQLGLLPHPEGGAYREVHRGGGRVAHPLHGASRDALTAIHFLLQEGEFSAWHEVESDEAWVLAHGGPLELHLISPEGFYSLRRLLPVQEGDEPPNPMAIVPAGWLQAARPAPGVAVALCACLVAPGFDFDDFRMPGREELIHRHPTHAAIIGELVRR